MEKHDHFTLRHSSGAWHLNPQSWHLKPQSEPVRWLVATCGWQNACLRTARFLRHVGRHKAVSAAAESDGNLTQNRNDRTPTSPSQIGPTKKSWRKLLRCTSNPNTITTRLVFF